jgi:hypothetical protein
MNRFNNKMYEEKYIQKVIGKITFGIMVFIISLMWIMVSIGV